VDVTELGPELRRFLDAHGGKGAKKVGYPLTLHLYGSDGGLDPQPGHYACELLQGKDKVSGVVHLAQDGSRRGHAQGLAVFYPLQPLKRGSAYTYQWSIGGKKEGDRAEFTTR
jgi:hypothetical protein